MFTNTTILPAIRDLKDIDKAIKTDSEYIVLLNTHIGQLKSLVRELKRSDKKVLLHADLVQGLKTDEFAAQFLCQDIRPDGIVSTRRSVLSTAKKAGLITIQRLFLLDSLALQSSYQMMNTIKPDCVEILPGIIPHIIEEVRRDMDVPVIAGGLIRSDEEVQAALDAGAFAVTTSNRRLWKITEEK
ncbi:glycerol-3-phosphate responsive antiterminator [Alkalicoccus urumqiensis]|uniref:Glycerol uptake operon antiterminator regulatory protein n=1 Tax=Alkalicoccus urumqiensis TaxID=1548213 RepID=A0A2P6MEH8_ALKUR|nr:glycerol-3-phosphate responsive antiterminator [Alkalicoccus urumqiensis]PRO64705.1 glycerol-3-phosphate responsive antiterminator GlpP [Alkalicoccus urumqiensis]